MIEAYIGRPGSGKTYTLTRRVLRALDKGRPVFANYDVHGAERFTMDDLLELPPGLIVIDEAHLWFPARLSMKLPASMLMKLSQTRKAGWDMFWAAQHESRVDRVLRDVTNWMWLCSAWANAFNWRGDGPLVFTSRCFEPENFRKMDKAYTRSFSLFSMKVARAYDTGESLEVARHVLDQRDPYRVAAAAGGPA